MLFDLTVADAAILVDVPLRTSSNRNLGQLRTGFVNLNKDSSTIMDIFLLFDHGSDLIVTQPLCSMGPQKRSSISVEALTYHSALKNGKNSSIINCGYELV